MTPKAMGKDKMSMLKVTLDQPHSLNLEIKIKNSKQVQVEVASYWELIS